MVDRTGTDDLILSENYADTSERGAFTRARPTTCRESAQKLGCASSAELEPVGNVMQIPLLGESATEVKEDESYRGMRYAEHIVLESRSFVSKATDVDEHDSVRPILLTRLAQGKRTPDQQ